MRDARIKELMAQFGMPDSQSLKNLITQVETETGIAADLKYGEALKEIKFALQELECNADLGGEDARLVRKCFRVIKTNAPWSIK